MSGREPLVDLSGTRAEGPTDSSSPASVRWQLLGPLRARRGGELLDIGPRLRRSVLAVVLASGGRPVTMSSLVDCLWGEAPPASAVNVIHRHVGASRRLVEPDLARRQQGSWLLSYSSGYRVELDSTSVDLLWFRDLVTLARQTSEHRSLDLMVKALGLWGGPAAADLRRELHDDAPFRALDLELAEVAIVAGELGERLGRPHVPLAALQKAAHVNPTDERLHAQLIRCLAGAGRRDEALRMLDDQRRFLAEQLGVEPGEALRRAQLDVLRDRVVPTAHLPERDIISPRQLPPDLAVFAGRESDLASIEGAVPQPDGPTNVVVVTGTAGVGKTSLVLHAAHRLADAFPDGHLYVNLRGFDPSGEPRSAAGALAHLLEAFDVSPARLPDTTEARAALWRTVMARQRLLIVLDNARDPAQVRPLLVGGTGSLVLVTSRHQLRGLAALARHVISLNLFDVEESVGLMKESLGYARMTEAVEAGRLWHDVSESLPLSLSLLTARARTSPQLSLIDLATDVRAAAGVPDALTDQADQSTDPRAVLSWSLDAVSEGAARLMALMSLYPGGTMAASTGAALADVSVAPARTLLDELAESHLLFESPDRRYARHDLLSRFASERLATFDRTERDRAEVRMYEHLVRRAAAACRATTGPNRLGLADADAVDLDGCPLPTGEEGSDWITSEMNALATLCSRAAETPQLTAYSWQLAAALDSNLNHRFLWQDNRSVQTAALHAARSQGRADAAAVTVRALARVESHLGNDDAAKRLLEATLDGLGGDDSTRSILVAELHRQLAHCHEAAGDPASALVESERALARLDEDLAPGRRGIFVSAVATFEAMCGHADSALSHATEALRLMEDLDDPVVVGIAWLARGHALALLGRLSESLHSHRRALELFGSVESDLGRAEALLHIGDVLQAAGHPSWARERFSTALSILERIQHSSVERARERLAAPQPGC